MSGRDSIQIMRRLRAMLENLMETVPIYRVPLLSKELKLLESSTKRNFPDLEDQLLAKRSDRQGMGGSDDEQRRRERITEAYEAGSFVSESGAV